MSSNNSVSLRTRIARALVTEHPQACQLLIQLLQAIDLEKRSYLKDIHGEDQGIDEFCLSDLDEWMGNTLDSLSLSDATPLLADHAFRVAHGMLVDLASQGAELKSAASVDAIERESLAPVQGVSDDLMLPGLIDEYKQDQDELGRTLSGKTRPVKLRLSAHTLMEYYEEADAPVEMTDDDLFSLAVSANDNSDGANFVEDPCYWESGDFSCRWVDETEELDSFEPMVD